MKEEDAEDVVMGGIKEEVAEDIVMGGLDRILPHTSKFPDEVVIRLIFRLLIGHRRATKAHSWGPTRHSWETSQGS